MSGNGTVTLWLQRADGFLHMCMRNCVNKVRSLVEKVTICHSMKHFLHGSSGIRQVCDMLLVAEQTESPFE